MPVTIDENILISVFAVIIVPFIFFHSKLLLDFRVLKTQLDIANNKLDHMEIEITSINKLWNKISILEVHVMNLLREKEHFHQGASEAIK